MIYIYYTEFDEQLPENLYNKYLEMLPKPMIIKNLKYKFWEDRHRHLFGVLLLIKGLEAHNRNKDLLNELNYNDFGRPFLDVTLDFNISHSDSYVICVLSEKGRVGVDVEVHRKVDFDIFQDIITPEERAKIEDSENPQESFYNLWAIKESVIKADGRGMSASLMDIVISDNRATLDNTNWFVRKIDLFESASAYLVSDTNDELLYQDFNFYKTEF